MNCHPTGVSTFASRTSPSTDQSLQKSLQSQPKRKRNLKKMPHRTTKVNEKIRNK
jgi:hypothetical protein